MPEFTDEMYEIVSTIRALAMTRKEPTSERDMRAEYYEINGEHIPYQKFGFRSLEQFLKESNEFILGTGYGGVLTLLPRPSKETAHIVSMVQRQKSSKKKKPFKAVSIAIFIINISCSSLWNYCRFFFIFRLIGCHAFRVTKVG